jgi:hypothetical protein
VSTQKVKQKGQTIGIQSHWLEFWTEITKVKSTITTQKAIKSSWLKVPTGCDDEIVVSNSEPV